MSSVWGAAGKGIRDKGKADSTLSQDPLASKNRVMNSVRTCLCSVSAEAGTGRPVLHVSTLLEASVWTHLSVSE